MIPPVQQLVRDGRLKTTRRFPAGRVSPVATARRSMAVGKAAAPRSFLLWIGKTDAGNPCAAPQRHGARCECVAAENDRLGRPQMEWLHRKAGRRIEPWSTARPMPCCGHGGVIRGPRRRGRGRVIYRLERDSRHRMDDFIDRAPAFVEAESSSSCLCCQGYACYLRGGSTTVRRSGEDAINKAGSGVRKKHGCWCGYTKTLAGPDRSQFSETGPDDMEF
jgi:hypothetical protein